LRIDFYYPKNQYILFANDVLNIYLPSLDIVLSQKADPASSAPSLATGQGLSLMKRSYIIAYETSASPKPIQEGSNEQVIVLSMERRNGSEPFRKLRLMVSPETNLIRRIEGFPVIGEKVVFDFSSYRINPGIPSSVFVFEPEHTSTILNDFLYME
jgi:outer membrane lipoprotein carrier protein lolA